MQKRYKDLLRTLVIELRHTLVGTIAPDGTVTHGDLDRELERLGIALDGTITPLDALATPTASERRTHRIATAQLDYVAREQRASARMEIVERAAYTWINRLLALRAMEARGLIDETLRMNPEYDGLPEALFVLRQSDPSRASGADGGCWAVLEDACKVQSASLPGLFSLDDPATALRPSTSVLIRCMTLSGGTVPGFTLAESDAAFADPDTIGWAYQFYQEEAKARIYAKLGSGGKAVTRAEIAAATELFTEPYMVKWLLQNSLGRSYHEIYPDSALPATWEYYIKPDKLDTATTFNLARLTVLDPCVGSGHFLREAFDMFVAMYREQFPTFSATEIADRILSHHLHGIDLDPRAAQLSALTLYLRAWELVREERRKERKPGPGTYIPPAMNLATTPTSLNEGALQRHLLRHPQDKPLKPLLEGIFSGLEHADILGSLLRPKEYLDNAITQLQQIYNIPLDPEEAEMRRTITAMANHDPVGLRQMLLDRIADSFKSEAGNTDDVSAALFGREAEQGVRLLQLLDRHYAVVVTNPPYMGSKNMDAPLKKYVEKYYPSGKRNIYAAFILRCIKLCQSNGRIAMITMHGWMFLRSFVEFRAVPNEKLPDAYKQNQFAGILRETSIEALAHLGRYAFSEIGNAVVAPLMFILKNSIPTPQHQIRAYRLIAPRPAEEQEALLLKTTKFNKAAGIIFVHSQADFINIPGTPIAYWLSDKALALMDISYPKIGIDNPKVLECRTGWQTNDNKRYWRYEWEIISKTIKRWLISEQAVSYARWFTSIDSCVENEYDGVRIRAKYNLGTADKWILSCPTLTWSMAANGSLGVRCKQIGANYNKKICALVMNHLDNLYVYLPFLNSRVASYLIRTISQTIDISSGYVAQLPRFEFPYGDIAVRLKMFVSNEIVNVHLLLLESYLDQLSFEVTGLPREEIEEVLVETGIPAGFHPLVIGYEALPILPIDLDLPPLPQELFEYLAAHKRINPSNRELARIKANLRMLYESGPGMKKIEQEEDDEPVGDSEGEEDIASSAHIPIPTETFLEELSINIQLHPISVYWLLEELRAEGVRCKPEESRLLEDRLSVLVLCLLGYRWPKQLEASEPVPAWGSNNGIIPFVAGAGEIALAEQVRLQLRAEEGELGVQQIEAQLTDLTGLRLEDWLHRKFFSRHVSQFKYRPIAWHLMSNPTSNRKKKRGGQRAPAFECLLYYHACTGDALARIRTHYVEPLLRAERQRVEEPYLFTDETASALAHERIQELEAFIEKLRLIEEQGFACDELEKLLAEEPLDRWSGDGYLPPVNRDELFRNEQAWHVDINDGVRVNIAPLQLAGVLASDVLKSTDARKALADRARWRADERRWVRDGKLPRCGWMDEQVPESQRWTEREPERIAEQIKLEQKRQALKNRQGEEVEL